MSLDEINRDLKSIQTLLNNQPVDDFDGRSPSDMFYLIHKTFDAGSPLQFRQKVDEEILNQSPFLKLTDYYLRLVRQKEPLELTSKGNLPVKIVQELYNQKIITEKYIESGLLKLYKEENSSAIHTLRIIAELAKLTNKKKGRMTLTKKSIKLLAEGDKWELFKILFITYSLRFYWAYLDHFGDHSVGQMGFAFTLEQLIKYGDIENQDIFYADKYRKAFPAIFEFVNSSPYRSRDEIFNSCFSVRTFERFLKRFGLVEIREEREKPTSSAKIFIKKTKLLDKIIFFN